MVKLTATDIQPVSIVEDPGFREFVSALDKRYVIPTRTTVREKLLPELFEGGRKKIKEKLEAVDFCGLTTDWWTSITSTSLMAVTVHFWDAKESKPATKAIDCCPFQGQHTGEAIAQQLEVVMQEFNISSKVVSITTDSGSNVVKAMKLLGKSQIPCFAHKLNLAVTDALKNDSSIEEIRDKVSKTVALTKRSCQTKRHNPALLILFQNFRIPNFGIF